MTTEDGRLVGLVSSAGALHCGKVIICCLASTAVHDQATSSERNFAQENLFDIYTDVAAYMTWISRTIKKMGGMQACDLFLEETNPKGRYDAVSDLMHNWVAQRPGFKSALRVVRMVLNTQCYQYLWLTI